MDFLALTLQGFASHRKTVILDELDPIARLNSPRTVQQAASMNYVDETVGRSLPTSQSHADQYPCKVVNVLTSLQSGYSNNPQKNGKQRS